MRVMIAIEQLNDKSWPSVDSARIVRQLLQMGHEAFIVHATPEGEAETELMREFADILLALPQHPPLHPLLGVGLRRHLSAIRPDIVLFRNQSSLYNLAPVAKFAGVKSAYMAGNVLQYNSPWMRRTLPWWCNRSIHLLCGCSNEVLKSFVEAGYGGPTRRIPLGVDWPEAEHLRRERTRLRNQLGYADEETVFCTVGNLVPEKQQITLLQACHYLKQRMPNFRFLVIGDGSARDELQAYCDATGLTEIVHFAGWQTDVFSYLAAADAFVFHSTDTAEGLGYVNLEAAGIGLPLVAADIRCLREVWPDDSEVMFAPVGNAIAFADCMEYLLQSLSVQKGLPSAAASRVRAEYSCEAMTQAYVDVFEEMLA